VIKASALDAARIAEVPDVKVYFSDDRRDADGLTYYAWSSNPDIALVDGNDDNVMKVHLDSQLGNPNTPTDPAILTVDGVNPGEAMITVRSMEPETPDAVHGGLGQWVDQTFKVVVQLD
jgi:hypothetical protein